MRIKTSQILKKLKRMWKFSVHCTYPQQWHLRIWQVILMLIILLDLRPVTFLIWFLNIFQIEQEQCITGQGYQIHQVIYHPQENLKM